MNNFKLDIKNLSFSVGSLKKQYILDNINLSFKSGELVGVLGPSGSGKSTLLKSICGFNRANYGKITINEENLYKHFNKLRGFIGYVPQDDIIHKDLSVYKTLKYSALLRLPPLTPDKDIENKINQILNLLELNERKNLKVKKLSGGQRKRVSIGVELLTSPRLMFLDEPTSGLDPALEVKMTDILRKLADEDKLIFISTHIMKSIEAFNNIVILIKGKLAFVGKPNLALEYFEVEDFTDIFHKLTKKTPDEWQKNFIKTTLFHENVTIRLSEKNPDSRPLFTNNSLISNSKVEVDVKNTHNDNISINSIQEELERLKKELE